MGLGEYLKTLLSDSRYTHSSWDEKHLATRNWREFEELLSLLWNDMGYETTVQAGRRDGGVDVIATGTSRIPFSNPPTIAVQAKHWNRKVPEPKVRDLLGVQNGGHRHSDVDAFDEAVLVTSAGCSSDSAGFTRGARQFAAANNVELIDGAELLELLNQSNLSPLRLGRKPERKWHLRESPCCGWSQTFSQNRAYAQTAEEVFSARTQQLELTESSAPIGTADVCEACLELRRDP